MLAALLDMLKLIPKIAASLATTFALQKHCCLQTALVRMSEAQDVSDAHTCPCAALHGYTGMTSVQA